jgi:hypothetical protein
MSNIIIRDCLIKKKTLREKEVRKPGGLLTYGSVSHIDL